MSHTVLTCHCGNTKTLDYRLPNAGAVKQEGWGVCLTHKGELLKICPTCYEQLVFHAQKIHELTGNAYVSISHLTK